MRYNGLLYDVFRLALGPKQLIFKCAALLPIDQRMAETMGADFMAGRCDSPQQRFDLRNVISKDKECGSYFMAFEELKQLIRAIGNSAFEPAPFADRNLDSLIPFFKVNREGVQFPSEQDTPPTYCHYR